MENNLDESDWFGVDLGAIHFLLVCYIFYRYYSIVSTQILMV